MAIVKLFAERERERLGEKVPDVLAYEMPQRLRVQLIHIWREGIGSYQADAGYGYQRSVSADRTNRMWASIEGTLKKELGLLQLAQGENPQSRVEAYFRSAPPLDALSAAELALRAIEARVANHETDDRKYIDEANGRFRQNSIGYQYESGEVVRVDSTYVHDQAVKPALVLLAQEGFEGANEEFMNAHSHYREGRYKESVNDALKAFESTMKCICDARGITREAGWTALPLIKAMFESGILSTKLESHMTGVRTALESGLPTVRNKDAGHGQGQEVVEMPRYVAGHALHLAAANIVLLVESHLANPTK